MAMSPLSRRQTALSSLRRSLKSLWCRKKRNRKPRTSNLERLKTFLANAPDSVQKRYLLITYWFKTYRDTAEVTPDYIYTEFREMGWTTLPRDAGAPL
jgi:hypothetical protein